MMMNSKRLILAFLTICSTIISATQGVQAADAPAIYQVGASKVDVTPDYPIRLNGFGFRREESEGVTQPIWIKAIAIGSDEERPVILFSIDSTGIRQSMIDKVAKCLRAKAGIDRERIVATFTHSHTTPKLNGVCDTVFSSPIPPEHQAHIDRYDAEVTDAFEKAALDALADRKPSRLEWSVGTVGFAVNRRMEKGPVDHALPVLVVRSADDNAIRAIYTSYACHCVTLSNNKTSGDWAGFAQHAIEMNHPGAIAMVSIGCGSDSNPSSGVTGDNTAAAADQGAQIADEVERLLSGSLRPISGTIAATLTKIDLPLNPPPDHAALEQAAATDDPAGYNAKFQLAKLDRGESLQTKLDYPIQIVAFGDSLAMVFLAGEVCVDYSLRLKSELDPERLWLHGYANDFCAYIPSERLLKEGGYGGGAEVVYFALPNTLATGLEEKIIGQIHKQIPSQFEGKGPRKQASAQPWPLDQALASIVPKKGFVVEVAAAEPLVADPVAIDFGPDGRMWVAEMPDYSRVADEDFKPNGSCRVLTDVDGDGCFDHGSTFADGLRFPTDVKAWGDGVIVCDAPDVLYFEDADGDGKAETRKVLLTGFETHNAQARVNSLRWGLDNWLYGSCGIFGGKIRTHTGRVIELGGRDFRFRPSTGELEPVTGATQQGRTRDDWGNWFGCDSSSLINHYPLDDSYLSRNPHIAPPAIRVSVPTGNDPSALHPIGEPSLFELSGPPGRPTAACGLEIYRDELMGNEFANNSFVAEPVNQLVHRRILSPRGATFGGVRADDEADVEFLASTDPWFRPVQIRTGPDGCLYIVDMHRAVIEHPKFIPEEALQQIDVTAGREQGRIYRLRRSDVTPRKPVRIDHLNAEGLAATIDSPNGPQRDMAQQLIVQRAATKAVPILKELVDRSDRPTTRLQALCTLDGLQALDAEIILAALVDAHPSIRRHAIRLSEPLLASAPQVVDRILKLVDDDDSQVALQLAYSLGELNDPRQAEALARLATKHPEEPYILAGVWSSVDQSNVGPVVGAILASAERQPLPPTLMRPAIRLIAELGNDDDLLTASKSIRVDDETQGADWRFAAAAELLEQSRRRSASVSGLLAQFAPMIDKARETLTTGKDNEAQQLAALRILAAGGAKSDELLELLAPLLEPQNSPAVQQAAIELVAAIGGNEAANVLLAPWPGYTSAARAQAFDVLFGSAELTSILLDRIEAGEISAADLDALQRQRLTTHPNKTLRDRAAAALTNALDSDRDAIVKQYVSAVRAIRAGDAGRGRQLFAKHCSSCHRLEDQGHEVGPDLAALTSREPVTLIESILDPNRAVDERYRSYSALTIDGLAHAGILTSETSTSITLTEQQGKKQTLLRSELDAFANTGKSLMPEGLERDLTPPDVADVVAYLAAAGLPAKKIDGNKPRQITPDYDGSLWLLAENAHIFGHEITYEKPHRNIGFWHDQKDFVAWDVEVTAPGEYEIYLHWACTNEAAGSAFIIEGGEPPISGETSGTGAYDRFQSRRIGRVRLNPGANRITVRPNGPLKTVNLMDLRGVYLTPVGVDADRAVAGEPPREGGDAATAIAKLVDGLAVGRPEEYQRIPKIWEEAIAAGRRNEKGELLRVMDLSLPEINEQLADWQAVVIGGGVVNGVSQVGEWPERRVSELLNEYPHLHARWDRTLKLAASMAIDQQNTKIGTRYDAFRILGAGKWEDFGEKLVSCLKSERNVELQMGLVSAMSDMDAEPIANALIASLQELANENRQLAIEALLRTPERSEALLNAIDRGDVSRDLISAEQLEEAKRSVSDDK